ncbi:hypothetical protein [Nostoc sp.]|uniref:hypothetical protein n=1 Tax=Nostoc sp. TaxID=1180 RepID=UPI002FFA3AD2
MITLITIWSSPFSIKIATDGRHCARTTSLETVFSDRYFMASSELNLLNTILLED